MTRAQWLAAYRDMRTRNHNRQLITWRCFRLHGLAWRHSFFAVGAERAKIRYLIARPVVVGTALPDKRLHDLRQRLALYQILRQARAA
jgi:hypothetical protein